jgi:hypothetical protein
MAHYGAQAAGMRPAGIAGDGGRMIPRDDLHGKDLLARSAMDVCRGCATPARCEAEEKCLANHSARPDAEIRDRAAALVADRKVPFAAAVREVLRADPQLAAAYALHVGSRK